MARAAEEYYRLLSSHLQRSVALLDLQLALEQVRLNEAKVAAGNGIPLDLSRARTSYAQNKNQVLQAENAIIQAEQSLLNRLNLDATIHLVPNEMEAFRKPLVSEDLPVEQLIVRAVKANPAVATGEAELRALGHDYKAVRSDLIPSVSLRAFTRGSGSELQDLQRSTAGGVTVNVNLLENMGLQVPLRERKQLIEQRVLAQKQLLWDIENQVMTAYLNSRNYESTLEAARQEVASARESYELAVGRFKAGYGINLDVLDAEVALTTARSNLTRAALDYNQAQVQLVEALGGITPEALTQGISRQGTPSP